MLPLLQIASDGREHSLSEAADHLARQFGLSKEDRREMLASGIQTRFENRIGWARTYLKKAGLLESPGRGKFRLTERGQGVLAQRPTRIDVRFLLQYPEFIEFQRSPRAGDKQHVPEEVRTPEDSMETGYQALRQELAQELLEKVRACSPAFFERLVVDLLVAMGYGGSRRDAGEAIGRSGDGGIDGIIKEDSLGLDVVCIQAKRWGDTVSRPIVQAFAGSLDGQRAKKGVLITTSRFSQDAREFAGKIDKRIVLIEGERLAELMIDHSIGVTEVVQYVVKKIDQDYFIEE